MVAADSSEPLRFARILLGREPIGFTSYQGDFTLEVAPSTQRLVMTFVDPSGSSWTLSGVLPFDLEVLACTTESRPCSPHHFRRPARATPYPSATKWERRPP